MVRILYLRYKIFVDGVVWELEVEEVEEVEFEVFGAWGFPFES